MNTAYIAYNMKDKNYYIIKKSTYDAQQYRFKTKYVIIYDIEYDDSHELQNMKLEEKPYGLEKAKEIVDKILGDNNANRQ